MNGFGDRYAAIASCLYVGGRAWLSVVLCGTGNPDWVRTSDLFRVKEVLSQLSYRTIFSHDSPHQQTMVVHSGREW